MVGTAEYGAVGDLGGDRREFEALFRATHRRIYGLACRLLGNTTEAEDMTQEAFVRAWQRFRQYDRGRPFTPWLARILLNLIIDTRYRRARQPVSLADAPAVRAGQGAVCLEEISDVSSDPARLLLENEFGETLQAALARLPDSFRVPVLLADVEECSYQEIAALTGCSMGTVRSRIHRGRRMLRRLLESGARLPVEV
jgi:RNA polymerase sigma-70 factor, ECF subfamily